VATAKSSTHSCKDKCCSLECRGIYVAVNGRHDEVHHEGSAVQSQDLNGAVAVEDMPDDELARILADMDYL
jgi:hypothetical protein